MNLKIKSIILVSLCFTTILAISYGFLSLLSRDIHAGIATTYAKEQVDYNRSRILQPLKQELVLARKLAHSTTLKNWLNNENNPELKAAGLLELENFRQFFSDHSYFCAIKESGHFYFNDKNNSYQNSEPSYTLDPNVVKDFWFFRTLEKGSNFELNVDYDEILRVTKVWINVVIRDGTVPIGIIGTGIDLSEFINSVVVTDQPGVTTLYIDKNGAIQAHNQKSYIDLDTISKNESEQNTIFQHMDTQQDAETLRAAITRLCSGENETEVITVRIDGSEYLVGIGAIHDIGWYNVTLLDTASIIGLKRILPFSLALFIALLLLSVTLTLLFNHFVLKRINRLNHDIQNFTQGGEAIFPAVNPHDEIGRLETNFQQMTVALHEHAEKLEVNVAEQTKELTQKNIQLKSAYRSIQRVEDRRAALNETTRDYLTNGDLEQSLELLVAKAAKYVGALAGRFLHCSMENGETRVISVSKMCWADPSVKIEDLKAQEAFTEYSQQLIQSAGNLLVGTLKNNKTMLLNAEQYLAKRSIPLPAGHPEIESLALTPISIGEEMLGVIALANCPGGFDANDEDGLEAFASGAALLIHADSRETAREVAEETARLRSTFLANMSHELRTPLSIIIGMNSLLRGMKNSSGQQNYLDKIGYSAKQLLALITDVLDLSKISEGNKLNLKEESFQPEEFFYGIAQLLAFRQDNRKVELHADISQEIPSHLIGDTLRLTQILNNLLSNALKFTPQGTATLKIVVLEETTEQVTLGFSIIDTGIGMTPEQMEKVFQPFVQVDSSATRERGGSGLGLAISQQLCQLMGGELSVESTLDQGSIFHFKLPFKIDRAGQEKTFLLPNANLQGSSALIVNSCPACCDILPPMLTAMQSKVDSVTSSSGALMMLDNAIEQGTPYSFVLIGQFLDEMMGAEFIQQFSKNDYPDTKKILLANPADIAELSDKVTALDRAEVISLPASPSDLLKIMTNKRDVVADEQNLISALSIDWQQAKVLLVDDNEMGRELGRVLLENVGIEVSEAENGLEAVDRVESEDFDLVLMDIQMPVLDGLSAARAIRALEKKGIENLPIIAMTAHSFDEHRSESLAAGMNGHITKPIDLETLYAELQRWLPENKLEIKESTLVGDSEYSDLEVALPGVDVKAGIHRLVGDRQLYIELLKKYVDQYSATETELYQELELKQNKEAILRVHTLKGVSGSLGATQLQKLAGQVEEQLSRNSNPLALKQMLEEHKNFLELLHHLPQLNQPAVNSNKPTGSKDELEAILEQIIPPLDNLHAHGTKPILAKIQEKEWPKEYHDTLLQLKELVDRYQFNLASDLVRELLNKGES